MSQMHRQQVCMDQDHRDWEVKTRMSGGTRPPRRKNLSGRTSAKLGNLTLATVLLLLVWLPRALSTAIDL